MNYIPLFKITFCVHWYLFIHACSTTLATMLDFLVPGESLISKQIMTGSIMVTYHSCKVFLHFLLIMYQSIISIYRNSYGWTYISLARRRPLFLLDLLVIWKILHDFHVIQTWVLKPFKKTCCLVISSVFCTWMTQYGMVLIYDSLLQRCLNCFFHLSR